jgi:O-antigen/teichoic acid export membrane protein
MTNDIARGVARNTWILLVQYALTWGTNILAMMFLPRHLGPLSYGHFYVATTIVNMLRVVVEFGGNYVVPKEISRANDRSGAIVADAAAYRTLLGVLGFLTVILVVLTAGYHEEVNEGLIIIGASLLLHGAITVFTGLFQGREQMQFSSLATFVNRVVTNIAVIPAVIIHPAVWLVSLIGTVASTLQFGVLFGFGKRLVRNFPRPSLANVLKEARGGTTYFLFVLFSSVYFRVDSVMLSKMAPDVVVGWYGGAYRIFDMMNFFPYLYTIAVYPALSRLWKENPDLHRRTMQRSLELMILIALPVALGLFLTARPLVSFFYGLEAFGPTVVDLQLLSAGLLFLFVDMILGTTLLASDRQQQQALTALAAIPLNVGLNVVLIPYSQGRWGNGGIGSALATVVTEVIIMVSWVRLLPPGTLAGFRTPVVLKGVVAVAGMGAAAVGAEMVGLPRLPSAVFGVMVYGAFLILSKVFEPAEAAFLRSILSAEGISRAWKEMRLQGRGSSGKGDS